MPKPSTNTPPEFIPNYDETKLRKSSYQERMAELAEKLTKAAQLEEEIAALKSIIGGLQKKLSIPAVRYGGYTTRWVTPGPPKPTLVPELVLAALGPAKFTKCQKPGTQRAPYFAVFQPQEREG